MLLLLISHHPSGQGQNPGIFTHPTVFHPCRRERLAKDLRYRVKHKALWTSIEPIGFLEIKLLL